MSSLAPIGVQLYTLREEIKSDLRGVLTRLAETGFVGVEPFGSIDHNIAAPIIKELGLQVYSMHSPLPLGDNKNRVIEAAEAYNLIQIVYPWHSPEAFQTLDGIKELCEELASANYVAEENGYTLAYHNHDFEFVTTEGHRAYDLFVENLDPTIQLQLDTYWVQVGGFDPTGLIRSLGERAPSLHIKDGPATKEGDMTAVGEGVIDVRAIVEAGGDHTDWLIVELDRCATDMMEAVVKSYEYMTKEGLARGSKN